MRQYIAMTKFWPSIRLKSAHDIPKVQHYIDWEDFRKRYSVMKRHLKLITTMHSYDMVKAQL